MTTAHESRPPADAGTVRVIEPRSGWVGLDLGQVWAYRELAYFFVWRDLKVRYAQTVFGVAWAVLQPVAMMLIFTLVLSRAGLAPAGVPYPRFALAGLVPWTLFSQSVIGASDSLVASANVIQKVYFPRLLLPISAVGSYLVDFAIGIAVLLGLMLLMGASISLRIVFVLPLAGLAILAALAVGIFLSAINVRYRDVRYALPFLVQIWLFASPVAYALDAIPHDWQFIYTLNPMAGVIEGFRWALLGGDTVPALPLLVSAIGVLFVLLAGLANFRTVELTMADVI
jgi:lipopolysaccharide transport system permease protein